MTGVFELRSLFRPGSASVALSLAVVVWLVQLIWPQIETLHKDQTHASQSKPMPLQMTAVQPPPAVPAAVRLPQPPPPPISAQASAPQHLPTSVPSLPVKTEAPQAAVPQSHLAAEASAPLQPSETNEADPAAAYPPLRPTVPTARVVSPSQPLLKSEEEATSPKVDLLKVSASRVHPAPREEVTVASEAVYVSPANVKAGRTWLRILEHGEGPEITIAWPTGQKGAALFSSMVRCYGLTIALHGKDGRLYADTGLQGEAWDLNLDKYSGFMRQVGTWHTPAERQLIQAIHVRHRGLRGMPVRLFSRRVDAQLLAGLGKVIGEDYADATSIRASYVLRAGRLFVENVYVGNKAISGKVDLSPAARCAYGGEI